MTPHERAIFAAAGALAFNANARTREDFVRAHGEHDWEHVTPEAIDDARALVLLHRRKIEQLSYALASAPRGLTGAGVLRAIGGGL